MLFGQNLIVGFKGTHPNDPGVVALSKAIEHGYVGGIIFFQYNITSRDQVMQLIDYFNGLSSPYPLFLAIDQEGGRVQRLNESNGFPSFKSARVVATTLKSGDAFKYYEEMATVVKETGFNLVFGPVVDILNDACPIIGGYDRAYDQNTDLITVYAEAFIQAHQKHGIITCLKHFPGHGSSTTDSHAGFVDITTSWAPSELNPFKNLIHRSCVAMVMTGHLWHNDVDQSQPATLSQPWIKGCLRQELVYDGVVITDDLCMGAILNHTRLEEAVIASLKAGNDIALISLNAQASINTALRGDRDAINVHTLHQNIETAISKGILSKDTLNSSLERVISLKTAYLGGP